MTKKQDFQFSLNTLIEKHIDTEDIIQIKVESEYFDIDKLYMVEGTNIILTNNKTTIDVKTALKYISSPKKTSFKKMLKHYFSNNSNDLTLYEVSTKEIKFNFANTISKNIKYVERLSKSFNMKDYMI